MNNLHNFKYFLRLYEKSSTQVEVPSELKHIMKKVEKLISDEIDKNKSFHKKLDFSDDPYFPVIVLLDVIFNYNKIIFFYKGDVDIWKMSHNDDNEVEISISINDTKIDKDQLYSSISHELRHIYDFLYAENEMDISSYLNLNIINKYKSQLNDFGKFCHLVYLTLQHEMIARNNMLYFRIKGLKIYDRDLLWEKIKKTSTYKIFDQLKDFNAVNFIKNNNINELIKFVNNFNKELHKNKIISNKKELLDYFTEWENYFHEKVDEYHNHIEKVIDDIIKNQNNESLKLDVYYEHFKSIEILENIVDNILNKI
jgi:hypothetical protein